MKNKQDKNKLDFEGRWPYNIFKRKDERIPVTVCIAAICKSPISTKDQNKFMVVGAADRMLTAGDIEFEPELSHKIIHFSPGVTGMFAGDFSFQTDVILCVLSLVKAKIASEPQKCWMVKEIAELYITYYRQFHLKKAENAILTPLGYDLITFHQDQQKMNLELLKKLW